MALQYIQDVTREAIVAAAQRTLSDLALVPDATGGANPLAHQSVSNVPLTVYSLGLERLSHGGTLNDASPVAWRVFVLNHHDEPVGAAEVTPSDDGKPPHFQSYNQGPQVAASGKALSDAAEPAEDGQYEPRFLEIPGIYTSALWLKNVGEGEDRVVPIEPVPRFLRDQRAYSPDEFLDRVRLQAAQRLDFDDTPTQVR